ncbi:MAG TPA: hypothetical protein VF681_04775 [Abditibacteriaceae bacterium]|jgi:hypothetical protein
MDVFRELDTFDGTNPAIISYWGEKSRTVEIVVGEKYYIRPLNPRNMKNRDREVEVLDVLPRSEWNENDRDKIAKVRYLDTNRIGRAELSDLEPVSRTRYISHEGTLNKIESTDNTEYLRKWALVGFQISQTLQQVEGDVKAESLDDLMGDSEWETIFLENGVSSYTTDKIVKAIRDAGSLMVTTAKSQV